jgi:hypothetical protein
MGAEGLKPRDIVDGLIWAASMVVLDASRRGQPLPQLAAWSLGAGICATVTANLPHGVGHGLVMFPKPTVLQPFPPFEATLADLRLCTSRLISA